MRFHAVSEAQRRSWAQAEIAAPEEIAPGFWAVALPMQSAGMPYSFGYAVLAGDGGVHIIDPGWSGEATLAVWKAFLAEHGRGLTDVATLLITHGHVDHLGAAPEIREISGARLLMSETESRVLAAETTRIPDADRLDAWGVPVEARAELVSPRAESEQSSSGATSGPGNGAGASSGSGNSAAAKTDAPVPDAVFTDGERIALGGSPRGSGGLELVVKLTPGHTDGHACFVAESVGAILTGDHVLPQINPGIGLGTAPGSDPLIDDLTSLSAMRPYDHLQVLPGHEYRFRGLALRSEQIAAHHLRRTREIAALLPELGDAPVWEYARRSPWSRGWEGTTGFMRVSALMQTELHLGAIRDGRAEPWLAGDWPAAS